jgi:hypothetical protein
VLSGKPAATPTEVNAAIVDGATQGTVSSAGNGSPNRLLFSRVSVGEPPIDSLSITTSSLPDATVGVPYSAPLTATGGSSPYTWSVTGLPGGLSLDGNTIGGTPSADGRFDVSVTVTDSGGSTSSQALTLVVSTPSTDSTPPTVEIDTVTPSTSGRWKNAKVFWTAGDNAALASVQVQLLNGALVLDSVTYSVSGRSASGETNLRTRGSPTDVRIIVEDAAGNSATETTSY